MLGLFTLRKIFLVSGRKIIMDDVQVVCGIRYFFFWGPLKIHISSQLMELLIRLLAI